jgi:hypothetical protein
MFGWLKQRIVNWASDGVERRCHGRGAPGQPHRACMRVVGHKGKHFVWKGGSGAKPTYF